MDSKLKDHIVKAHVYNQHNTTHINYLCKLKEEGFEPKTIYDIGACVLEWKKAAKMVWPNARYIVFDANEHLEFLYQNEKLDYYIGVLSDQNDKEVKFYKNDYFFTGNSYYKNLAKEGIYNQFVNKKTKTLDSVVEENSLPLPDLIKMDVQGAEIDVLKGAQKAFSNTKHLLLKLQHTIVNEGALHAEIAVPMIETMGWKCTSPVFCNYGLYGDYGFQKE